MQKTLFIIRLVLYFSFSIAVCISLYAAYNNFIMPNRLAYSEEHVRKSIVNNYTSKKAAFKRLQNYAGGFRDIPYLFLLNNDRIRCRLRADSAGIWNEADISFWINNRPDIISVDLDSFKYARLTYPDTIINIPNWYWEFKGSKHDPEFSMILNVLNLSPIQFDSLSSLVKAVDCEAISISNSGDISLIFDGMEICHYGYEISTHTDHTTFGYTKIDEMVYCGKHRHPMFCGSFWWRK